MSVLNPELFYPEKTLYLKFWDTLDSQLYKESCEAEYNAYSNDKEVMLLSVTYTHDWRDELLFVFSLSDGKIWTQTVRLPVPF